MVQFDEDLTAQLRELAESIDKTFNDIEEQAKIILAKRVLDDNKIPYREYQRSPPDGPLMK